MDRQSHLGIQQGLDAAFAQHDSNYEKRTFRSDQDQVFNALDEIRRRQIELATDHIALENLNEAMQLSSTSEDTAADEYQQSRLQFAKKENALKDLMKKLDDIGTCVDQFLGKH
ncbi:hypothetical protein BC940DRAFT_298102 [Gongronella butleri]|nr:hypothetical protein BC940DRAFT_298102 [Gongronella butleri]